jgi:ABC-type transport system involved in multi-copper enzyme maturation permease subunit
MINKIIKITQNEIYKLMKQKFTYFSIICVIGIIVLWGIGANYFFPEGTNPGSGYLFLLLSTQTSISFVGVILILIFCSMLISAETSTGTLQMILINPISRLEFFIGKAIAGMIFSFILFISTILTALIIGGIHFGYGDYVEGEITLFTKGEIFLNIFYCFSLLLIPLFAFCCYGLLISVFTSNVGSAIGFSVGSILFLDVIREKLNLSRFLFQSYIETPFEIVKNVTEGFDINWKPDIFSCIGVPAIWIIFCLCIGFLFLSRKDYKS